MADVFISYSRKNAEFARRLIENLNRANKDSWVDWEGIPQSAPNWWNEIKTGIENADNFIFIMSPDSMASVVCNLELDYALELHKRIIPIVYIDVESRDAFASIADFKPDDAMKQRLADRDALVIARDNWQKISHINWMFFREQDDFEKTFVNLIKTVETDDAYVKAHTRYLTRAREWQQNGERVDLLLFGEEIQIAEQWLELSRQFAGGETGIVEGNIPNPLPQDLQRRYILVSREAEKRRQRNLRNLRLAGVISATIGVIAIAAGIFAGIQAIEATNLSSTAIVQQAEATIGQGQALFDAATATYSQGQALSDAATALSAQQQALFDAATATHAQGNAIREQENAQTQIAIVSGTGIPPTLTEAFRIQATSNTSANAAATQVAAASTRIAEAEIVNTQTAQQLSDVNAYADSVQIAIRAEEVASRGEAPLALALALEASQIDDSPQAMRILSELAYQPGVRRLIDPSNRDFQSLAITPDGRYLFTASGSFLYKWDVQTGRELGRYDDFGVRGGDVIIDLSVSPDGTKILAAGGGFDRPELLVMNIEIGQVRRRYNEAFSYRVTSAVFSPNGEQILAGTCGVMSNASCQQGELVLLDTESGEVLRRYQGEATNWVDAVAFSSDGRRIFSGARHRFFLWDTESGELLQRFEGHQGNLNTIAVSPDGRYVVSGGGATNPEGAAELILWDAESGALIRRFVGHEGPINQAVFSADGQTLFSASSDRTIIAWDVESAEQQWRFQAHTSPVLSLVLSPDGKLLYSGSGNTLTQQNGEIIFWDIDRADVFQQFSEYSTRDTSISFSPDGQWIVSGDVSPALILWDALSGQELRRFEGMTVAATSVAFSPLGDRIVSGGSSSIRLGGELTSEIILWDVETGQQLRRFDGIAGSVKNVAISPDGSHVLASSSDIIGWTGQLGLWDINSRSLLRQFEGASNAVTDVTFSSDGSQIIAALGGGAFILWDRESSTPVQRLVGHQYTPRAIDVSPDNSRIVSAGCGDSNCTVGEIILWDRASGELVRRMLGHGAAINSVSFSPDGEQILTASSDGTTALWDIATGQQTRRFQRGVDSVLSAVFSPDGQQILSVSSNGTWTLWRNESLSQLQSWITENRYVPELTCEQRLTYELRPC